MKYYDQVVLDLPYAEAVGRVRTALAEQGFGVLTEIDVKATLKAKIGEDVEDYVILGACNPALAHRALAAERSLGVLLPCNVVVRAAAGRAGASIVEFLDPQVMATVPGNDALTAVAEEAGRRLAAARGALAVTAEVAM
jgi:uncharacterized protein (DUF302 family)